MSWYQGWKDWRRARRDAIGRYYQDEINRVDALGPGSGGPTGQPGDVSTPRSERPEDPRWSAVTALFGSAIVTVGVLAALVFLLIRLSEKIDAQEAPLSLVFVSAAVILILVVCTLTIVLKRLGLTDVDEPMGLPRGSIRAIIALLLILLFFIAAIFMFSQTRELGGDRSQNRHIKRMSAATYAGLPVDQIARATPRTKKGVTTYNVILYPHASGTATSDDLAKQIVTTVATLVTAVAAFYFGANSVSSAHRDAGGSGRGRRKTSGGRGDGSSGKGAPQAGSKDPDTSGTPRVNEARHEERSGEENALGEPESGPATPTASSADRSPPQSPTPSDAIQTVSTSGNEPAGVSDEEGAPERVGRRKPSTSKAERFQL